MTHGWPVVEALRALAKGHPQSVDVPALLLRRLVHAGLGPCLRNLARTQSADDAELLTAADLTARVISAQMLNALAEILRAAPDTADRIVLLKGIAACQRHYPEPHQRLMGDIDLLVTPDLQPRLEAVLRTLGYVQRSEFTSEFYVTHHHSMPFFHPSSGVWVEVHRALFPSASPLAQDRCFQADVIWASTSPITVGDCRARVLSDELHLLYTCGHWGGALNTERGLMPMLDVIFLLRATPLDWDWIRHAVAHSVVSKHIGLMLGYLYSRDVTTLDAAGQRLMTDGLKKLGRLNAELLYRIIDRYVVGRQEFGRFGTHYNTLIVWDALLRPLPPLRNLVELPLLLFFPPGRSDRFSPALILRRLWAMVNPRTT